MTHVLILMERQEATSSRYRDLITAKFPGFKVDIVGHHSEVDPYIADVDILMCFSPPMADHVVRDAPKLKWIQALGTGNAVLAIAPGAPAVLSALTGKGLPLAAMDGAIDADSLRTAPADVVAFSGVAEEMRALRRSLAAREGPIVPLVSEVLYPAAYAHERAVCVDTTAAGGNASLLASA